MNTYKKTSKTCLLVQFLHMYASAAKMYTFHCKQSTALIQKGSKGE